MDHLEPGRRLRFKKSITIGYSHSPGVIGLEAAYAAEVDTGVAAADESADLPAKFAAPKPSMAPPQLSPFSLARLGR